MTVYPVILHLPAPLYTRLKHRADQAYRTLEAELLDVLATAVPVADELPADVAQTLSKLTLLNDEALWQAARSYFPAEAAAQLEALNFKQQREGLTKAEAEASDKLARQYERAMLVRAQAAVLLKQRGYDVSKLLHKE